MAVVNEELNSSSLTAIDCWDLHFGFTLGRDVTNVALRNGYTSSDEGSVSVFERILGSAAASIHVSL